MTLHCSAPKAKVKPVKEQHPRPAQAQGVSPHTTPRSPPFSSGAHPSLRRCSPSGQTGSWVRGCCRTAHTHALCNVPVLRGGRAIAGSKTNKYKKTKQPEGGKRVGFALPFGTFPPTPTPDLFAGVRPVTPPPPRRPTAAGARCGEEPATAAASTCARLSPGTWSPGREPPGIASRLRGSALGAARLRPGR